MAEIAIAVAISAAVAAASYTLQYVLTPKPKPVERGRLQGQLQIQDSAYGSRIPWILGGDMGDGSPHGVRVAGNVIFLSEIRPVVTETTQTPTSGGGGGGGKGGGGGGGSQKVNETNYFVDIGICFGQPGAGAELELQALFAATDLIYDVRTAPGPDLGHDCAYGWYWNGSACVQDACGVGEVRDPTSGLCVPRAVTGAVDPLIPSDSGYGYLTPPDPYSTPLYDSTLDRFSYVPTPNVRNEVSTNLVAGGYSALRFYPGNEVQLPDPLITAEFQRLFPVDYAAGRPVTPAFLDRSYVVLQDFNISKYGAIPNFTAILRNKDLKTAAQILVAMCAVSGVNTTTELDVTALATSKVRGMAITNRASVKQTSADTLARRFPFDWTQKNGKLTTVLRGGAAVYDVPASHLGFKSAGSSGDTPTRVAVKQILTETKLPRRVEVKAFNPAKDFEIGQGDAKRQITTSKLERLIELNMSLTEDECREIAQRELDTAWLEERLALSVSLPHTYAGLAPTDVITINDGASPTISIYSMRIREITGGLPGALEVSGVPTDAALYVVNTFPPPTSTGVLPLVPATVIGTFIDGYYVLDRDTYQLAPGYYAACASVGNGEFRGATLYRDFGLGYVFAANFPVASKMGRAATLLTDLATTVDVDLYGLTELESFSAGDVTAGRGWVFLGGESFQYQTATPQVGFANRWRLSVLSNRGGRGTTAFTNNHAANERFVVLDDGVRFVYALLDHDGDPIDHKFVAAGMGIDDVAVVSFTTNILPGVGTITDTSVRGKHTANGSFIQTLLGVYHFPKGRLGALRAKVFVDPPVGAEEDTGIVLSPNETNEAHFSILAQGKGDHVVRILAFEPVSGRDSTASVSATINVANQSVTLVDPTGFLINQAHQVARQQLWEWDTPSDYEKTEVFEVYGTLTGATNEGGGYYTGGTPTDLIYKGRATNFTRSYDERPYIYLTQPYLRSIDNMGNASRWRIGTFVEYTGGPLTAPTLAVDTTVTSPNVLGVHVTSALDTAAINITRAQIRQQGGSWPATTEGTNGQVVFVGLAKEVLMPWAAGGIVEVRVRFEGVTNSDWSSTLTHTMPTGGGGYVDTSYASLSAAVTAIGATVATLRITTANFPNGSTTTVPATLTLQFEGPGSILMDTGETVTIASDFSNWPIRKLFYNALAGTSGSSGIITPTNVVGGSFSSNIFTKSGSNGWNAGFASTQLISGDGYIQFTGTESSTSKMCGLSPTDPDQDYQTIDFAIQMDGANWYLWENGTYTNISGAWTANTTVFKIERIGTTLTYYKDGVSQRVVNGVITSDLMVDTSVYTNGATLGPITLSDAAGTGQGTIALLSRLGDAVYPEWWGASPTASAATNTSAIQTAIIGAYGTTRTNASGNWIYNRALKFSGMYDVSDKLDVFHMNGFRWEGTTKFGCGINQTTTNKQIINGESVSYGVFNQLKFSTGVSQNTALIDLDYSGAQGDDLRPQNVTFLDCIFAGDDDGFIGVRIAKSGGGAQGDNVRFHDCYASGFAEAAVQLGGGPSLNYAFNAIHVIWTGGDIQGCPKYGLAAYGGSFLVDGPTFENGNVTSQQGVVQTGFDLYSEASQNINVVRNVRSESIRFASGQWRIENCVIQGPSLTLSTDWRTLPGTTAFVNQFVQGTVVGGDGRVYRVLPETPVVALSTIISPFDVTVITNNGGHTVNAYAGMYLRCVYPNCFDSGYRLISSNTANTITLASPLPFTPGDNPADPCGPNSRFEVIAALPVFGGLGSNTATSGSSTTIVKTSAGWTASAFVGMRVAIHSGAGKYQYGVVTSNTSDTITCSAGWVTDYLINADTGNPVVITNPASGSVFAVEPNWNGGSLTSGTADLECFDYNVLDGRAAGSTDVNGPGFTGSVDGFSSDFSGIIGGRIRMNSGKLKGVLLTRQDWHYAAPQVLDNTYPSFSTEGVTVQRYGGSNDEKLPWSISRNTYANTFRDFSHNQQGKEWTVWSQGDVGGGVAHVDVAIGRGDGVANNDGHNISRNVLGFRGTLGRKTPAGVDQAGSNTDLQGGLSTGSGAGGAIKFWIADTGSTGTGVNPGAVVAGIGANRVSWTFKGADVASAAAIVPTGNLFHVTGTTTITSITSTGITAGTEITIIFDGVLTFTDGSNLKLAGNFTTAADSTITLKFDGTNWFEVCRSAN